jgi:ribosome biogenesis protein MAK21
MPNSSLLELFFDLLLISVKQDTNLNRVMAFVKRLFQVCFTANPNFIITCLIAFSKIRETHSGLHTMLNKP